MSFHVVLGDWTLPLVMTMVAFGFAIPMMRASAPEYSRLVNRIFNLLILSLAIIASLFSWLAWALVIR
ncbi:hypothetical protein [Rhizobium lentis]|uniref:hypothetical protein n=1 Tax=Rhizobium lentis TaxID=1138194 RepID=UPI001C82CA60|nr:hypothetical protein [Rhizobium lentis]MBX5112707.1 hypothetical protein [Rhizobium lentis]